MVNLTDISRIGENAELSSGKIENNDVLSLKYAHIFQNNKALRPFHIKYVFRDFRESVKFP